MGQKSDQNNQKLRRGEFTGVIAEMCNFSEELKSLRLVLNGPGAQCFAQAKAGQFVQLACRDLGNLRCPTPLLRRPFSIAGIEREGEQLHLEILYRVRGPGTNWLAHRSEGETINLLGPLGNGFTLPRDPDRRAILVGGGVGLPPMFFLADKLAEAGFRKIVAFAGARSRNHFIGTVCLDSFNAVEPLKLQPVLEQFNRSGTGCILATDDGSCGYHGFVVDALDQYLTSSEELSDIDLYACGPDGMLRAISVVAEKYDLPCQVCMEAYMSCGIGLCQSCVVQVRSLPHTQAELEHATRTDKPQYKLVCTNGPVFDSKSIVWE